MKHKFSRFKALLFITASVFILSCQEDVIYPIVPVITFKDYEVVKSYLKRDSVLKLTISYTDGDGDLGLTQYQLQPPFDSSSIYYYNMYVYYFEYFNNTWNQVTTGPFSTDTIRFKYRFPYLTPTSENKAIKGEIECTISDLVPRMSNTVMFKIFIYDRNQDHPHQSNIVESGPIVFIP